MTDKISFADRVAIVTGAGNGLGRTYALDIARRGGAVVVNDIGGATSGIGRSKEAADAVVRQIVEEGGRAVANYDDVGTVEGAKSVIDTAISRFGKIDTLINNAGNLRSAWLKDVTEEDFLAHISTHLFGTYYVTQACWPHMLKAGYGRVVFTTSAAALLGNTGLSAYAAGKGGVAGLMRVMAEEGKDFGIICNAVAPNALGRMSEALGAKMTADEIEKMAPAVTAMGNSMQPDFTTALVVYLASEACKTTHGIYSSLGGRYSRVFIGVAKGWQGPRDHPAQAEDVATHFDQIRDDKRGYYIPENLMDEYRILLGG